MPVLLGVAATVVVAACSGGGNSTPPTAGSSSPPLGGIGPTISFNQRVNFTVLVPPAATTAAVAASRRKTSSTTTTTNPYVSPKTGSVSLQFSSLNGQSPQTLPASIVVNISCPGSGGCSVPIQNVPAAKGVDRFSVQTFAGTGGTGNLISSSYIDVTVPSAQAVSFGGTALTIGGYVGSLSLALNEPGGGFITGSTGTGTIDVNAIDPAGAIIIGNDQLANPISISTTTTDGGAFTLNGQQQVTVQQPAQTLTLAYNGAILQTGIVQASTIDENSNPVTASVTIPVALPPTPKPSPVSVQKPPLSLYVYDANANEVLEYAGVNGVEAGGSFGGASPVPRRVFEVAPAPTATNIVCPFVPGAGGPNAFSLKVSLTGSIYVQSDCYDGGGSAAAYTFVYGPTTSEIVTPGASPTPPAPSTTFSVPAAANSFVQPAGIALDETNGKILLQYVTTGGDFYTGWVFALALASPTTITNSFGSVCLQELGQTIPCTANLYTAYPTGVAGTGSFAVDSTGYVYVPVVYGDMDATQTNVLIPPGPGGFQGEPAVAVFPESTNNPAPTPYSVLAGFNSDLGGQNAPAIAIEGTTLYALAIDPEIIPTAGNTSGNPSIFPGLSGCGTTPDQPAPSACADGSAHSYLVGYKSATSTLESASLAAGTPAMKSVELSPSFELGGQSAGGFGYAYFNSGNVFDVHDDFAYVINQNPPSDEAAAAAGQTLTEIDVYNTQSLGLPQIYYTTIFPVTRLMFPAGVLPTTIAVGPTSPTDGSVSAAALLRRGPRVHYDFKAWALRRKRMLNALRARHGLPPQ